MSQQNVEIVRRFYDAWAREEVPGPVELMDLGIEYEPADAIEAAGLPDGRSTGGSE